MPIPRYAELHCRTNFSFLSGASHPEELVTRAQQLGYSALAITDECSLAGVVRAHVEAKAQRMALIIGSEIQLTLPRSGMAVALEDESTTHRPAASRTEDPLNKLGVAWPSDDSSSVSATGHGLLAGRDPACSRPSDNSSRTAGPSRPPASHGSIAAREPVPTQGAAAPPAPAASRGPAVLPDPVLSHGPALSQASPVGSARAASRAPRVLHARLVLLAQSRRGYGNLSHWITIARRRAPKGDYLAHPGDVEGKAPTAPMLAGLPGCMALLVPSAAQSFDEVFAHAMWLKTWFQERAAIAIELLHRGGDDDLVDTVLRVAGFTGLPIVAAGDVLMHVRSRKPLQDTLSATRLGLPVAACGHRLQPNAEQHLRSRGRLGALYEAQWLENTIAIAGQCEFSLDELKYEYPQEIVPPGESLASHLRNLTYAGVTRRFPGGLDEVNRQTIEGELAVIAQLEYEAYFLTVADIVHWARDQGILCQGRGSAANSLVCYCLGVTEVDPRRATLLFGRFISVERNEPPDIDIDFEHQRREEVVQYIYKKYGRHRAALTAVVISYRPRSALRDVGRALGIDLQRIEAVSKSQHWFDGRHIDPQRLRENGFDPEAPVTKLWIELTQQLIGFPRHLSQHPGGFVIARERMSELVPVENASMKDRSVIQWDKDDLDALGLLKVDILAIGMLSAIRRALEHIGEKSGGPALQMQDIPDGDTATYDMICAADTIGVFQIESRAQMSMLPRLQPRCYYDLVVEVAIVRPGPIQGGMVHPYLNNRRLADDEVDCPEELKPALIRTKGVPIFQEQVMQIAMLAADFSAGEADALRRAMAAWKRKGGLSPFHERLVGRMVEKGYAAEYAERIFKQIEGFGEYGFPESHAAGFALLAYVSSWIKCHHPDALLVGLLNSQPMGFYAPAQLVRDAREHGVEVRPVDVLVSGWESVLESGGLESGSLEAGVPDRRVLDSGIVESGFVESDKARLRPVRLGLNRIKGISEEVAGRIVAARADCPFATPEDLAQRARLDSHDLAALAGADALQGLAGHRHQAAWAVRGIDTRATPMLRDTRLHEADVVLAAPSEADDTLADYRFLRLTLKRHPLALLREELARFRIVTAATLRTFPHGRLARASGLVTHRQRPETAKGTMFVTLEDETGAVNVIVWPRVAEVQRQPLLGAVLLTVYGQWQRQGEGDRAVMHLLAMKMIDHTDLLHGLESRSRDFR